MATRRSRPELAPSRVGGDPGGDGEGRHARRSKLNPQACNPCRQFKAKCDGLRPSCSQCLSKGRDCEYTGAPGQTRYQALHSKLLAFEKLYTSLQAGSPTDAAGLLERIRSSSLQDMASLSGLAGDNVELEASESSVLTSPSVLIDSTRSMCSNRTKRLSRKLIQH